MLLKILKSNIFILFLTFRLLSVYFNQIWDCDETYNYWEPLHFLAYGTGMQTWEYSPQYSLRSYLYIFSHLLPVYPVKLIASSKITVFYALRFLFALSISFVEADLYKSLVGLSKKHEMFKQVPGLYLMFSLTSVGMFTSVTSFLPSTFAMYLVIYAYSQMYTGNLNRSIFAIGLAILMGWPFVLILGVPILIDYILLGGQDLGKSVLQRFVSFCKIAIFYAILIATPIILFDSYLYGKLVFAPMNIFIYNVFETSKGPDLYGREPFSFYVKNLILNFNILFPASILSIALMAFNSIKTKCLNKHAFLTYLGMFLWLLVFMTRPHKEERFLYPIYPLILINSSLFLTLTSTHFKKIKKLVNLAHKLIIIIHFILSLSRLLALLFNFQASSGIYIKLNEPGIKFSSPHLELKQEINVCVSKEWYRFPSNFFIPEKTELHEWNFRFLETSFKGQLPGYFNKSLSLPESTRFIDSLFNDWNREVRERYIGLDNCDFLIDTDDLPDTAKWRTVAKLPFLDLDSSSTRSLYRTFYVPWLYEKNVKFTFFKIRVRVP